MKQDTREETKHLSNRLKVKAWLLEGNVLNHKIAREMWGMNYLPQRIKEVEKDLEKAGIGYIKSTYRSTPGNRRADHWKDYELVRYTDADKVTKEDTNNE